MNDTVLMVLKLQKNASERGKLAMWTIFDRPKDYPHGHVARMFEYDEPTACALTGSLSELREIFEDAGLVCLTRNQDDHPSVVETWT